MEVSGQFHSKVASPPTKEPSVTTGQATGWVTEPVWTRWRR